MSKFKDIIKLDNALQKKIIQQYESIRQSCCCNMLDFTSVKYVAQSSGFTELYDFMKDSISSYKTILSNLCGSSKPQCFRIFLVMSVIPGW